MRDGYCMCEDPTHDDYQEQLDAADALAKAAKPFANYEHLGYYDDIICKLSCTCGTDLEWDQKHESDCEAVAFISALAAYEKARGSNRE